MADSKIGARQPSFAADLWTIIIKDDVTFCSPTLPFPLANSCCRPQDDELKFVFLSWRVFLVCSATLWLLWCIRDGGFKITNESPAPQHLSATTLTELLHNGRFWSGDITKHCFHISVLWQSLILILFHSCTEGKVKYIEKSASFMWLDSQSFLSHCSVLTNKSTALKQ